MAAALVGRRMLLLWIWWVSGAEIILSTTSAFVVVSSSWQRCHAGPSTATLLWAKNKRQQRQAKSKSVISTTGPSDQDALHAMERLEALDEKLGVGCGASKERAKLQLVLDQWEKIQQQQQQQQQQHALLEEEDREEDDDDNDNNFSVWDHTKFVAKHAPTDRVAIFGGDPNRRRRHVEQKLAPFAALDQYGTPRDVGLGDTTKLLHSLASHKYDVVYLWTRFNCHSSRAAIRDACAANHIRLEEVESLAYIRPASGGSSGD